MDDSANKKKRIERNSGGAPGNRRRIATIVHDDRGMGSIEWHDAPPGEEVERPVLQILENPGLEVQNDGPSHDPYAREAPSPPRSSSGNTTRTNLRQLSEWIKLKREVEERRLRGDVVDDDEKS